MFTNVFLISCFLLILTIAYSIIFEVIYFRRNVPSKDFVSFFYVLAGLDLSTPILCYMLCWDFNFLAVLFFSVSFVIALICYNNEKKRFLELQIEVETERINETISMVSFGREIKR